MRICIPRSEKYNNSFFAFLNYLYLLFIWFLSFILKIDTWKVEKKKRITQKREVGETIHTPNRISNRKDNETEVRGREVAEL